jgi:6,7-dimethyl-8-ribityllumazine synthase
MDVQLKYEIPFAFEILYVKNLKLARERLEKGREAAAAALSSLATLTEIRKKAVRGEWGLR